MTALKIYKGRRGEDGLNGINGLGPADVNDYLLENPILDCLQPNNFTKNAFLTWDRSETSTYRDRYGVDRFSEQERYTNWVDFSDDFTKWSDLLGRWSIVGSIADPLGGNDATEINIDDDTINPIGVSPVISRNENGWDTGGYVVISFYIKRISGDISALDVGLGSDVYNLNGISDDWERKIVKVSASNGGFNFSINPRGLTGARLGLFGVQIEETVLNPYLKTNGTNKTFTYGATSIERQNSQGYLIEDSKRNLCLNTQDFNDWSVTDGLIEEYNSADTFGFEHSKISVVFGSLPTIKLETETEALTQGVEYTVSFYAFIAGGSLTNITGSLGGGEEVIFSQPSVNRFERISAKLIADDDNALAININSDALTAQLFIHAFQIEEGELSSYNESSTSGQTRSLDAVNVDYEYNAVAPSFPFTLIFEKSGLINDTRVKTVFSNGQSGANEFSLYFQNDLLSINNGGNVASFNLFDAEKIAVTYNGSEVKFYNEQREVFSSPLGSTSFISDKMYIGSNGSNDAFNAYISKCMLYNVALSNNDIAYLLGV